jgi:hypothetical protein
MKIPELSAVIERRLLISYSVDPPVLEGFLPPSLRLQLVNGKAVAGACFIRLGSLRPAFIKPNIGWTGENAAHRIAVEYEDENGVTQHGVYVPQRHANSWVPVLAGGRIFPGVQEKASFTVSETQERIQVGFASKETVFKADVTTGAAWKSDLFPTVEEASAFYQNAPVAFSPDGKGKPEGLKLSTDAWKVEPGHMVAMESSFYEGLPAGSVEFDHVLVMRNVPITWSTVA